MNLAKSQVRFVPTLCNIIFPLTNNASRVPLSMENLIVCLFLYFLVNDGRVAAPQYRGLSSAFTTIFRQEGLKGLYKGVTPNAWGSGSAWGFYFLL